jgi:hypothetical protein
MASIVGEKYRNAEDEKGWNIADKIFGYIDTTVNIYNKYRTGYVEPDQVTPAEKRVAQTGAFGLPKPWGAVIITTSLLVLGLVIYKSVKK